jgi:hypothetical protein
MADASFGENTTATISTSGHGLYGARVTIAWPRIFGAHGAGRANYFDAYFGIFGETSADSFCEVGTGYWGEAHDHSGHPGWVQNLINPYPSLKDASGKVVHPGGALDGEKAVNQRQDIVREPSTQRPVKAAQAPSILPFGTLIPAVLGSPLFEVDVELIIDKVNHATCTFNGGSLILPDGKRPKGFTFGKDGAGGFPDPARQYARGFDIKACIGYVNQDYTVYFWGLRITVNEVLRASSNGKIVLDSGLKADWQKADGFKLEPKGLGVSKNRPNAASLTAGPNSLLVAYEGRARPTTNTAHLAYTAAGPMSSDITSTGYRGQAGRAPAVSPDPNGLQKTGPGGSWVGTG